jgi:hypothetical protein
MLGHRGLCFQLGGQRPGILGGVDELGDGFCFVGWVLVGISPRSSRRPDLSAAADSVGDLGGTLQCYRYRFAWLG